MDSRRTSQMKPHKRSGKGILFGIPLLLFISAVILLSIGSYNYLKYAFYFSRLFIRPEVKPTVQSVDLLDPSAPSDSSDPVDTSKDDKEEKPKPIKIKFPSLGDEFGELIIDSASMDYPVYHGDRDEDLLKGAGHYMGSRYPGEGGNIVLAGHRDTVFRGLKDVKAGDTVVFQTSYGKYVYVISDIRITSGDDNSIVAPSDKEKLTLYTCYPFNYIGHAPKRYVVTCDLVDGTPLKELMGEAVDTP